MLSIEKRYPDFAESCQGLLVGKSAYSSFPGIPFDLHRYGDGWHVYWKNPPNGQIGLHLRSRDELTIFLKGNWSVGIRSESPARWLAAIETQEHRARRVRPA
jgi:hypothetical protein